MNEIVLQQASMNGFIRTVLIIVGIWYAFKFLMRLLAPYLMKKMVQKAEANFRQNYEQQFGNTQNQQYQNTDTSSANKNSSTNQNPRTTKKIGEYIDYEEVE